LVSLSRCCLSGYLDKLLQALAGARMCCEYWPLREQASK
jgi:hypothetical protein